MRIWTRRSLCGLLPALLRATPLSSGKGTELAAERKKFPDPVTEFEVVRLTEATYESTLPPNPARIFSRKSHFFLFASNRTGTMQGFRMEIKSGNWKQITQAEAFDADSLVLMPQDRLFCYFDGLKLMLAPLSGGRDRVVYEVPTDWQRNGGLHVSEDGVNAFAVEQKDSVYRLRMIGIARGTATTLVEQTKPIQLIGSRPRRASFLYQMEDTLMMVNFDGQQNRKLKTEPGKVQAAVWSPDGRNVIYLHIPDESTKLNALREHTPDTSQDVHIARTSQFVAFSTNADASVFLGASRSKASPDVLVLLRASRRELTLAEHKATAPAQVRLRFSPSSERVLFQTDKHGKPAIYTMDVHRLIEVTEADEK